MLRSRTAREGVISEGIRFTHRSCRQAWFSAAFCSSSRAAGRRSATGAASSSSSGA